MIQENLAFLLDNLSGVWKVLFNRVMILSCSSQIVSMLVKSLIKSVKNKKFSLKEMASYGGMPSSHTAFIVSATLGLGIEYGWNSGVFGFAIVSALIVLVDAVKLRGTIDRVNERSTYLTCSLVLHYCFNLSKITMILRPIFRLARNRLQRYCFFSD